ncbi:hypothetical protein E4T66_19950 [Sinimarinibacterium sp. CAU 1509]|uniref:hypothetical protein n=1 Tax=Sinimarinibacterium sp. CAU 1509 TaxID=2562283 RepID=UPI0010AC4AB8|nr:hypothetical protein [Sinimarinibacterium sp. CAU 1509]TJY56236.1 hypothetical protein E4T66_19950 [Sinimarinibacterium sp. CAU 1509]
MTLLRALLLALIAAAAAALIGMGVAVLTFSVPTQLQPDVLMEQQPMQIRFKEGMAATLDAARLQRLQVRGQVETVLPVRDTLSVPLRGRYRLRAQFDQRVPVRLMVRHTVSLPVTTTAEIEAATQFQYAGAKQYRNVRFRARLPLRFNLQLPLEVHVDTLARVTASVPLTAVMNQDLRVDFRGDLRTRLDLDHVFHGVTLGAIRATLRPQSGIVNIIVTRALLRWPWRPSARNAAETFDPDQLARSAVPNNDTQGAHVARMQETAMIDASFTSGIPIAPYIYALLGVFTVCVAIFFLLALNDADDDTWLVRGYQRLRLARLRLRLMLENRQFDLRAYLRAVPVAVIKRQIAACRACPCKAACDRALACREAELARLAFCPNVVEIEKLKRLLGFDVAPLAQA